MNPSKFSILAALVILILASLACSFGGNAPGAPASNAATEPAAPAVEPAKSNIKTEFPMPDDATSITDLGDGAVNFQTKMSIADAVAFYRDAFTNAGYKEREITTVIEENLFSIVFDGHASGKAIVVQGVGLGNGVLNVNVRFEDA